MKRPRGRHRNRTGQSRTALAICSTRRPPRRHPHRGGTRRSSKRSSRPLFWRSVASSATWLRQMSSDELRCVCGPRKEGIGLRLRSRARHARGDGLKGARESQRNTGYLQLKTMNREYLRIKRDTDLETSDARQTRTHTHTSLLRVRFAYSPSPSPPFPVSPPVFRSCTHTCS